jgi:hypothetical protein
VLSRDRPQLLSQLGDQLRMSIRHLHSIHPTEFAGSVGL